MEKPLLKLTTKDFLTGISQGGAHIGTGGLFYKADGVTPLFEAGVSQSTKNGLLMAGAAGTTVAGTLNGTVISQAQFTGSSATTSYFGTSTGHIFTLVVDSAISNTLTDAHTATSLRHGLEVFSNTNASNMLFYFMDTAIGRCNLSGTYNDTWATISTDDIHASHQFSDRIFFGNSNYIGQIFDDGTDMSTSGTGNFTKTAFNLSEYGRCSDISDDGIYLIIACTKNVTLDTNMLPGSSILFWDFTSTTQAQREYKIQDPFIYALERTPAGVFAYGVTGIWQVAFGSEPKRVFAHPTGIYSTKTSGALQYGQGVTSHYGDALLWGGTSGTNEVIKTLGKLDVSAPTSYLHPFLTTAGQNLTYVDGSVLKGYVFVGDSTPQLVAYPFSGTPQTGLVAQTAYITLPSKTSIERIDLIFGEPLASGDSVSVSLYKDQIDAAVAFGSATFTGDGAIRRKQTFSSAICEDQFSIAVTFTAGAVKIKAVEIYGKEMST